MKERLIEKRKENSMIAETKIGEYVQKCTTCIEQKDLQLAGELILEIPGELVEYPIFMDLQNKYSEAGFIDITNSSDGQEPHSRQLLGVEEFRNELVKIKNSIE